MKVAWPVLWGRDRMMRDILGFAGPRGSCRGILHCTGEIPHSGQAGSKGQGKWRHGGFLGSICEHVNI